MLAPFKQLEIRRTKKGKVMQTILIVILLIILLGGLPSLGFQTSYGYGPSGLAGILLLVLIILLLTGRL